MGTWHLANTKQYITEFGRLLSGAKDYKIVAEMTKLYPDRFNSAPLLFSSIQAFEGLNEEANK